MSRLGIYASSINANLVTNSFESIATVNVGSGGASSIDFTSISGTYKHLQIRAIARGNNADIQTTFRVRFNSDTGTNYSRHRLRGDGSTVTSIAGNSENYIYLYFGASGTTASTNVFAASIWDILDYANTSKNTTLRFLSGVDSNGSGAVSLQSGGWYNTAAVTSINITADGGGNFNQYSQFALYGIKG